MIHYAGQLCGPTILHDRDPPFQNCTLPCISPHSQGLPQFSVWIVTYIVLVACVVLHVIGISLLIFQCRPTKKPWRPLIPGVCLSESTLFYSLAIMTMCFDIVIFILPIPFLLGLSVNLKKRLVLCGVFLLGLLTTVCSILRVAQIHHRAKDGNSTMLVLWGVIELNVGVSVFPQMCSEIPNH